MSWLVVFLVIVYSVLAVAQVWFLAKVATTLVEIPRRIQELSRRAASDMFWAYQEGHSAGQRYYVAKQPQEEDAAPADTI